MAVDRKSQLKARIKTLKAELERAESELARLEGHRPEIPKKLWMQAEPHAAENAIARQALEIQMKRSRILNKGIVRR